MAYVIRPVQTRDEYRACEKMQAEVMGMSDLDVVPGPILRSFATSGGAVIGAFDGAFDGAQLVGVVFGYTGLLEDGTPYHRSQRLAVLPACRGLGVGEALKRAQAEHARRSGLRLMCWTFDPLLSRNAHLNLHKLGAFARRYLRDAYTASRPANAGAPADRLWVEWEIGGQRPEDGSQKPEVGSRRAEVGSRKPEAGSRSGEAGQDERARVEGWPVVLRCEDGQPAGLDLSPDGPAVVIQIPDDIDALRARDAALARNWRAAARAAFEACFARGYRAVEFIRHQGYILKAVL
jgi:predicted GNAT superfamily acetyltransferase